MFSPWASSQVNSEYDYALFTDEDCQRFMCELADPDVRRAYEVCRNQNDPVSPVKISVYYNPWQLSYVCHVAGARPHEHGSLPGEAEVS